MFRHESMHEKIIHFVDSIVFGSVFHPKMFKLKLFYDNLHGMILLYPTSLKQKEKFKTTSFVFTVDSHFKKYFA